MPGWCAPSAVAIPRCGENCNKYPPDSRHGTQRRAIGGIRPIPKSGRPCPVSSRSGMKSRPIGGVYDPLLYAMPYVHTAFDECAAIRAASLRYYAEEYDSTQWSPRRLAAAVEAGEYFAHTH